MQASSDCITFYSHLCRADTYDEILLEILDFCPTPLTYLEILQFHTLYVQKCILLI